MEIQFISSIQDIPVTAPLADHPPARTVQVRLSRPLQNVESLPQLSYRIAINHL